MFEQLEKRAMGLCIAIPAAIIVLGRFFGGSLWGLIPLAACVSSGVWLWMHEVIRSGKEMEWSSEQLRGETVRIARPTISAVTLLTFSDPYAAMSTAEESPAQRAARLRRERREAKIKEGGSARLDKITSLSGRTPQSGKKRDLYAKDMSCVQEHRRQSSLESPC